MSNSSDEQQTEDTSSQDSGEGITDDKLPEDLRPTDDNPLAKPMGEDEELVGEDGNDSGGTTKPADGSPDPGAAGAS